MTTVKINKKRIKILTSTIISSKRSYMLVVFRNFTLKESMIEQKKDNQFLNAKKIESSKREKISLNVSKSEAFLKDFSGQTTFNK